MGDPCGRPFFLFVETGRAPSPQSDGAPNTTTLDISHLPSGVYFLRLGTETVKVVKQ
jgi:hypothetical protein